MSKKANILTAIGLVTALSTTPANAEKLQDTSTTKKMQQVVCKTKLACEKLSLSIQAQIKEIENSDDPDFDKLDELQNKLIAVEKAETQANEETIANEVKETKKVETTGEEIKELRDALLSKID